MSPSPRRLQFVVGTSLLGSLALGCATTTVEPVHVNPGPGAETPPEVAPSETETPPEVAPIESEGSDPEPPTADEAPRGDTTVNVRTADPEPPQPKRVNTRPNEV